MVIKTLNLLDCHSDEEDNDISWEDSEIEENTMTFDCGCCDDCTCDENIACESCNCECCLDFDDGINSNNFNINIIEDNMKETKVRITLEIKVNKENMYIDIDINRATYLKIAEELFKQK
jgi:hypothetical protein